MNDKRDSTFGLGYQREYEDLGEGRASMPFFFAPNNTRLFPFWAKEALDYYGAKVIRREVSAEPDLKWTPKFKKTMFDHEISLENLPNFEWTD